MALSVDEIINEITAKILSGGRRTTADNVRTVLTETAQSFSNFKTGGLLFEVESGYSGGFRPNSPGAFATVDMLGANLPDQTGQDGKFLQTNAGALSWQSIDLTGYVGKQYISSTRTSNFDHSADVNGIGGYSFNWSYSDTSISKIQYIHASYSSGGLEYHYEDTTNNFGFKVTSNGLQYTRTSGTAVSFATPSGKLGAQVIAMVSDFGGSTPTEVGYLSGTFSNVQNQINNINSGLSWKVAARVLVGTSVTISSPGSLLDGITMTSGDRVVLNGNSTGSENGVYLWNGSSVPMTRTSDASTGGTGSTGVLGMTIAIEEGTSADTMWILTNNAPITIGTTVLVYARSSATTYTSSNGIILTGNNFTFDTTFGDGRYIKLDGTGTSTTGFIPYGDTYGNQWASDVKISGTVAGGKSISIAAGSYSQISVQDSMAIQAFTMLTLNSFGNPMRLFGKNGKYQFNNTVGTFYGEFDFSPMTANHTIIWQNKNYTGVADLTDVAAAASQWTSTVTPNIYYANSILIGATGDPVARIHAVETSIASTTRGIISDQYSATGSARFVTRTAGGTYTTPAAVSTARIQTNWASEAYDGTSFIDNAAIRITVVGTVGTGRVPTKMDFMTMTDVTTGVLTTGLTIDQNQNITIPKFTAVGIVLNDATGLLSTSSGTGFIKSTAGVITYDATVVTGTGTANRVALFSGTNTLNTSVGLTFASSVLAITGGLQINGGSGAGRIFYNNQITTRPTTTSTGIATYSSGGITTSTSEFGWVRMNNALSTTIFREFNFPDASITVTYPIPDAGNADTVAYRLSANTFTGIQTYNVSNIYALGAGLKFTTGTNGRTGSSTLAAGTVTVSNTSITTNSQVLTTARHATTPFALDITYNAGVGFTITSANIGDTRVIDWVIIERI